MYTVVFFDVNALFDMIVYVIEKKYARICFLTHEVHQYKYLFIKHKS